MKSQPTQVYWLQLEIKQLQLLKNLSIRLVNWAKENLQESKTSVSTEEQKRLPETGESQSDTAIFLAGVSLALSAAVLATKRKEN